MLLSFLSSLLALKSANYVHQSITEHSLHILLNGLGKNSSTMTLSKESNVTKHEQIHFLASRCGGRGITGRHFSLFTKCGADIAPNMYSKSDLQKVTLSDNPKSVAVISTDEEEVVDPHTESLDILNDLLVLDLHSLEMNDPAEDYVYLNSIEDLRPHWEAIHNDMKGHLGVFIA